MSLPRKLSTLLARAVRDARACQSDRRYVLDMCSFHAPLRTKCHVCMAGAVMARSLNASSRESLLPHDFGAREELALVAIDFMRNGAFLSAANRLSISVPEALRHEVAWIGEYVSRAVHPNTCRAPWRVYGRAIRDLKALGL